MQFYALYASEWSVLLLSVVICSYINFVLQYDSHVTDLTTCLNSPMDMETSSRY